MRAAALIACVGSLLIGCASRPERSVVGPQTPAVQFDDLVVAMPTLDFEPQAVPNPEIPIPVTIPEAAASSALFECRISVIDGLEAVRGRWKIRSISSTRTSARTTLTEQERFFADWYPDLRQPTVFFHVEADRP